MEPGFPQNMTTVQMLKFSLVVTGKVFELMQIHSRSDMSSIWNTYRKHIGQLQTVIDVLI
jgi:hypothetical protein